MDSLQIVVLAIVQGITEFLPISSSGHLILVPYFTNWPDQGLEFDLAVHIGTLTAIVAYFRKTLAAMARDWVRSVAQRREVGESRLAWAVLFGTIPALYATNADPMHSLRERPTNVAGHRRGHGDAGRQRDGSRCRRLLR